VVKRFDCLKILREEIPPTVVTVTSFTDNGRGWGYLRGNHLNLFNLHMGQCVSYAVGIAAGRPDIKVVAIDSDGSFLLDVGSLVSASTLHLKNLVIFVMDNEMYATHGPTATADGISIEKLAKAVDFGKTMTVSTLDDFRKAARDTLKFMGPALVVAKVDKSRAKIPGYELPPDIVVKEDFVEEMKKLKYRRKQR
jgi:sulfopyruvate decarboxylase subunit beta